jgi:membrane protein required for beta-lactamase induction
MFATFFSLQVKGAEYKNWQQNPETRKSIQTASLGAVISFIGLHISLWSIYGILTPLLVMAFYVFALSFVSIVTAFSGGKGKIIKP